MARRVFYSAHYNPDNWRAAIALEIRSIEGNRPATDNDWQTTKRGGDAAVRNSIANQTKNRSCTVVLVGASTASRKCINHEIVKSWDDGVGVVGIHVHGLKDSNGYILQKGRNPFDFIFFGNTGKQLSSNVKGCRSRTDIKYYI